VANEITTPGFWQEFRERIKAVNPEAYIVAEIWEESQQWLQGDQFDAVMNYPLTEALIGYAGQQHVRMEMVSDRSYYPKPNLSAEDFAARVERLLSIYPWPVSQVQLNLLDSHDTARYLTIVGENEASFRLATLLMFALPGAPSVYYGDEVGVTGGRPDALARWTFPWDRLEVWNHELLAFYKQVIALRLAQPALRIGDYRTLVANGTLYAFARTLNESTLVIAANAGDAAQDVDVPLNGLQVSQGEPQILFGNGADAGRDGDTLRLVLPAQSGVVLSMPTGSMG
jgi:glycosidase